MLVLDTGSADDTVLLAQAASAEVSRFDWCDDFAAARNAALEQSAADWNLELDADEWLAGGAAHLAERSLGGERFPGLVPVTSEFDLQGGIETASGCLPAVPVGHKDHAICHEHARAVRRFGQALEYARSTDSIRHDLVLRMRYALKQSRQFEVPFGLPRRNAQQAALSGFLLHTGRSAAVPGH